MGDQIGTAVEGTLYYVPMSEFERVRSLPVPATDSAAVFANMCRINALYMIARAGSGHIGSSFSSMDIMTWMLMHEIRIDPESGDAIDVYFSSKGHDAPGFYSALIGAGRMDFELIHGLRRIDGLPGHPDVSTECIETNTGSLGMGVSKGKGMATAARLAGSDRKVYVMTGDGELQEGQFWESLISGANHDFGEVTVIVDHNKLQSDTFVAQVSDLGDLEAKFRSFGWHVERCDGNNVAEFAAVMARLSYLHDCPKVVIADTVKGKGVSFMEHTAMESDAEMYRFHSGAPDADSYTRAAQELIDLVNRQLNALGADTMSMETIERTGGATPPENPQRLIGAYSRALVAQAAKTDKLVVLDADLILDTGLIPFKDAYPDRFVECGIAEQDMVSQAGGMALKGLLPVVHSFACFLSARPNEQIYNNSTEGTKIIYAGSLAGVVPGGPGHSHQAVRDISTLAANPGMTLVEPATEAEAELCVNWAVDDNDDASYIRLVSLPWPVPFTTPADFKMTRGQGYAITEGKDVAIIGYGPVLLTEAYHAAAALADQDISAKVINLPWLNTVDTGWLAGQLEGINALLTLDNHYLIGGQGERVLASMATAGLLDGRKAASMGIDCVPHSGTNDEVLSAHGLDRDSIIEKVRSLIA